MFSEASLRVLALLLTMMLTDRRHTAAKRPFNSKDILFAFRIAHPGRIPSPRIPPSRARGGVTEPCYVSDNDFDDGGDFMSNGRPIGGRAQFPLFLFSYLLHGNYFCA